MSYALINVPAELKARQQWVGWKREPNEKGKATKRPYQALAPDHLASCSAPETWASAVEAFAAYLTPENKLDGIGYQLTAGDGIVGIDIDHCTDASGALNATAQDIVATINSYTEWSPSREGIRIFVRGSLPPRDRKNGDVEMYAKDRFLTVTGWHVAGTPLTIEHRQAEIERVHQKYVARVQKAKPTSGTTAAAMSDHEVLSRCRHQKNREKFIKLYDAVPESFSNEADFALIGMLRFYTQDAEQIERLVRGSKLVRDKWDEPRPGGTYLTYSIGRALEGDNETYTKPQPKDEPAEDIGNRADGLQVLELSTVKPKNTDWLWPKYIPSGTLTLLVGDPEQGKSTITFDLVARITTGRPWPDGTPGGAPENVMLLSSEDSVAEVIVPRLLAAGVDISRVRKTQSVVAEGKDRHFSFRGDLPGLDAAYETKPFRVLIVDPINAYLPGVDANRDNEVRSILGPLMEWAEKRRVAVIAMIHLGKNNERTLLQRVLGSTGFVAAARCTYVAMRDAAVEGRRLFLCAGTNVGLRPPGLAFRFESRELTDATGALLVDDMGKPIQTVGLDWEPVPVRITAEEAVRALMKTAPQVREETKKFLLAALAHGPVLVEELEAQAAAAGLSWRTLERTKDELGVKSRRAGFGEGGRWYWTPPGWTEAQINEWKGRMLVPEP